MKPIYLKMTAFASYCGTAEVNFTQLYDNGIFLITGKTGGGKTTILDAICTALYREPTGSERCKDWRQLRCTNAPDKLDTEIEYTFSIGTVRYRFYRRWHMPNSKKTDRKLDDAENACWMQREGADEWELIASGNAKAVNEAAESIIKLTHEQFVKVIMLPQGEFRELLVASSSDKAEIFKKLFDTGRWESITDAIKEEAARLNGLCEGQRIRRQQALDSAECATYEELSQKTEQLKAELDELALRAAEAEKQTALTQSALNEGMELAKLFEELASRRKALAALEGQSGQYSEIRGKLALSRRLRGLLSEYSLMKAAADETRRASEALDRAKKAKIAADRSLAQARAQYEKLPGLEQDRNRLLSDRASLDDLALNRAAHDRAAMSLEKHTRELSSGQIKLEGLEKQKKSLEESIKAGHSYLEQYYAAADELPQAVEKTSALRQSLAQAQEYEKKSADLAAIERQLSDTALTIERKQTELASLRRTTAAVEQAIRSDKAYSLAADLTEGTPCPVCGSLHHPKPALPAVSTPTAAELDMCRKNADAAETQLKEITSQYSAQTARRDLLTRDIETLLRKTDGAQIKASAEIASELEAAKNRRDSLQVAAGKAEPARAKIARLNDELSAVTADIQNTVTHINNCKTQTAADGQAIKSLEERLNSHGIASFDELEKRLTETDRQLRQTQDQIKQLTDTFNAAKNAADSAEAILTAAADSLQRAESERHTRTEQFSAKRTALEIPDDCDMEKGMLSESLEADYERRLGEYDRELAVARTRTEQLIHDANGRTTPEIQALTAARDQSRESERSISEQRGMKSTHLESLNGLKSAVEQTDSQLEKLETQLGTAKRMSLLLSGRNDAKMTIHTYVLGVKMDEIITCANLYLRNLTDGQYAMRRKDGGTGRSLQGLDIEILDSSTGGVRGVSTLSGGELFLASLSLAFGLSDMVQSFAGGIHLDSLFIDEGFGSLDSETLDTAIEAITQVRENKLLGIISHVSELQERIPYGIEVVKNRDGSSLKIRT